jgi:hypothetical protein
VRELMKLKSAGMPTRAIARLVGRAPSSVRVTIRRFDASGLSWRLPDDVTDAVLGSRLFASCLFGLEIVCVKFRFEAAAVWICENCATAFADKQPVTKLSCLEGAQNRVNRTQVLRTPLA